MCGLDGLLLTCGDNFMLIVPLEIKSEIFATIVAHF